MSFYNCGWAKGNESWLKNETLYNDSPHDRFDGVIIFDISNPYQPKEISK